MNSFWVTTNKSKKMPFGRRLEFIAVARPLKSQRYMNLWQIDRLIFSNSFLFSILEIKDFTKNGALRLKQEIDAVDFLLVFWRPLCLFYK